MPEEDHYKPTGDHDDIDRLIVFMRAAIGFRSDGDAYLMTHAADELERFQRNLELRDKFIVSKGLFNEFVDQLPK